MTGPVLVTGGTGQVGGAIAAALGGRGEVVTPARAELDLTSEQSIRQFVRELKPRWILNPGAYTAVDKAESEPELARAINAEAPRILGEEAARLGAMVVHFSTDYVFPGTGSSPYRETDATGPLSVYGTSKLAGEQALAASGAAHVVLRTSWVYGATGKNFLLTMLRLGRERGASGQALKIVDDQHGAPTSAAELARVTLGVMAVFPQDAAGLQGVYHVAGAGETTWFGFAREIFRLRQEAEPETRWAELVPIGTAEFPTPARRPPNSRLDCSRLASAFGLRPAPWQEELAAVMAQVPPHG